MDKTELIDMAMTKINEIIESTEEIWRSSNLEEARKITALQQDLIDLKYSLDMERDHLRPYPEHLQPFRKIEAEGRQ